MEKGQTIGSIIIIRYFSFDFFSLEKYDARKNGRIELAEPNGMKRRRKNQQQKYSFYFVQVSNPNITMFTLQKKEHKIIWVLC